MANIKYKLNNQWINSAANDIDGFSIWQTNSPTTSGVVVAGKDFPNSVWKSDSSNISIGWKDIQTIKNLSYSSLTISQVGDFYRYGQFVVYNMPGVTPTNNITSGTDICTNLPEEYCPAYDNPLTFVFASYGLWNTRLDIRKNNQNKGTITFYSNDEWVNNQTIYCSFWWLTDYDAKVVPIQWQE